MVDLNDKTLKGLKDWVDLQFNCWKDLMGLAELENLMIGKLMDLDNFTEITTIRDYIKKRLYEEYAKRL